MSSTSQQPLFGRAWELTINTAPDSSGDSEIITISSSAWDPEALRIAFEVDLPAYKSLWFAKIEIYNANAALMQKVLTQGMSVTLKAGYQIPGAGTIFQGEIYQPMWERVNVTDFKLTLMCYTGLKETIGNFVSLSGSRNTSQAVLIANMCQAAHNPIAIGSINSTVLGQTKLPRARAFFGDPNVLADGIASANGMQSWVGFDGLNVGTVEANNSVSTISYGPTTGLLGTPQQTQDGVEFKVLLDPRIVISAQPNQVKLDMSAIRQLPVYPGDYRSILDNDGLYIIMGVRFVGDSRGNDWYADVIGTTSVGGKLALLTDAGSGTQLDRRSAQ